MERAFLREYQKINPQMFEGSDRDFNEKSRVSVVFFNKFKFFTKGS